LRTFLFKIFCAASSCAMASPATALANSASSRPPLTSSASSGRFCTLRAVSLVSKAAAVRFEDIGLCCVSAVMSCFPSKRTPINAKNETACNQ